VHRSTGYHESTCRYFVGDERPAGERQSLAGLGGTHDGDRVVECRAGARPHLLGVGFQ
jgi:hypothetical protein